MNIHMLFAEKLPNFAVLEIHLREGSLAFSLLAMSDNKSFPLLIFGLVVSVGLANSVLG